MEEFANMVSALDYILNTRRKRHITGGLLLSAAALFAGLAITVMSTKGEDAPEIEEEIDDE
ncbi:MAG: histidine kinase [Lachnospiraceae bacterium]|nr:histidine kinase [Lachnospiraceae bacterium]